MMSSETIITLECGCVKKYTIVSSTTIVSWDKRCDRHINEVI